jgi:N-acetylmuramoyl-L-alanine amidase
MPIRTTLFLCLLTALPALAATAAADDAYQGAKAEYQKLKKDEKRRTLRHHWLNVGRRFEAVATKFPRSERAPEALFLSGELFSGLSRLSQNGDDLSAAERSWRRLIDGWPTHRLADDAAFGLARLLADRRSDPVGARTVLEASLDKANDKKKDLQRLLASLPAKVATKKRSTTKKEGAQAPRGAGSAPTVGVDERRPVTGLGGGSRAAGAVLERGSPRETPGEKVEAAASEADAAAEGAAPEAARRVSALTEALRRLNGPRPVANPEREDGARAQAPRAAEPRPTVPSEAVDDAAVEPAEADPLSALQERLRDVRVGPRKLDPAARARLSSLAKRQATDEVSLAQQLGLKMRRVVIDAGHGGHDTGAIGPSGVREKDVSLAIALKLKDRLEALGLEVVMTRDDDTFVALDERTRLANRERGDLFISVHCNAAPSKNLRGIETYTLNTSSNRYSVRLAARENATTERGVNDLQYILADLATKANTGESGRLAERVQQSLIRGLSKDYGGVRDLGTKDALFVVLLGAKMPAILVETSFLSNPDDELRLSSDEYQGAVAAQIAEAVDGFLEARNKIAQVD